MRIKYTMIFAFRSNATGVAQGGRQGGWSESHYGNEGESTPNIPAFTSLMMLRAAMLPFGAAIVGQRYQPVDPVGGSTTGKINLPGNAAFESDVPQMAINTRVPAIGQPNQAKVTLAGVPDQFVRQGEFFPQGIYDNLAKLFIQGLGDIPFWWFLGRNLSAPQADIQSIDGTGTFQLKADLSFAPDDQVRILRAIDEDDNRAGGVFRVATKASPRTGTLAAYNLGPITKGRMRIESNIFCRYAFVGSSSGPAVPGWTVVQRKVGAPFAKYRGKASRRR